MPRVCHAVPSARLGRAVAAAFQHGSRADEARAGQGDGGHPAMRRPAGVQPLQPGLILLEDARGLAAAQPKRPDERLAARAGQAPGSSRRCEGSAQGRWMERPIMKLARAHQRQPAPDLQRRDEGGQHLPSARAACLACGQRSGHRLRASVIDGADMRVVEVEAVRQDPVHQRGGRGGQPRAAADRGRGAAFAQLPGALQHRAPEVEAGGCEGDAEDVEEMLLGEIDHFRRHSREIKA